MTTKNKHNFTGKTVLFSSAKKTNKTYALWLNIAKGIDPLPEGVVLTENNCIDNHWPNTPAVRYASNRACVMCLRRRGQRENRGMGSDNPDIVLARRAREDYEEDKVIASDIDWFSDIE